MKEETWNAAAGIGWTATMGSRNAEKCRGTQKIKERKKTEKGK
jgi:hypothetical protein